MARRAKALWSGVRSKCMVPGYGKQKLRATLSRPASRAERHVCGPHFFAGGRCHRRMPCRRVEAAASISLRPGFLHHRATARTAGQLDRASLGRPGARPQGELLTANTVVWVRRMRPAIVYMSRASLSACDRRESFSGESAPTKSVSRALGMLTRPSQPIQLGCFNPSSGPT